MGRYSNGAACLKGLDKRLSDYIYPHPTSYCAHLRDATVNNYFKYAAAPVPVRN